MTTGLLIPIYNRPEYLKRCLDSLAHVDYPPDTVVMLIDDGSTDKETIALFNAATFPVMTIKHRHANRGIKLTMAFGYEFLFTFCDVVINLDSDAIVKPNFITRLLELHKQFPNKIISGFNSKNTTGKDLRNPIIREYDTYIEKRFANGINMLLSKCPDLSKGGNWDFNLSSKETSCIVAKPSLVQHIGLNSTMGHVQPDVACDFKLLSLPKVMLFGIDAHDTVGIQRAATICTNDVEFGDVQVITERLFQGREGYSKFMIRDLHGTLNKNNCSHVLTIHSDGFIVNPMAWCEDWLKLDYIGATWVYKDGLNVGNGGFSLRSKKFIEICSRLDIEEFHPEDCLLSRRYRPFLEKEFGLKWGTDEQANKFSIEAYGCSFMTDSDGVKANRYAGSFGFHGYGILGLPHEPAPKKSSASPVLKNRHIGRR